MRVLRIRLAIALVSMSTIGLELALMRALSLRFWSHFAYMVIGVALLGFGASGTMLSLLRSKILGRPDRWMWPLTLSFALSVLVVPRAAQLVPLNVRFLAWNPGQVVYVLLVELLMLVPFFLAGAVVGIALMDQPDRISGHYAANLIGSGLGAALIVLAMYHLTTGQLFTALAAGGYVAAALLVPWGRPRAAVWPVLAAGVIVLLAWLAPWEPALSQYKTLSYLKSFPGTKTILRAEGPLGRIDVVEGPAVRQEPALSFRYEKELPPGVVLVLDGEQASPVYQWSRAEDWAFMDYTTQAAAFHVCRERPRVLVVGAGGGTDIGLALYHRSAAVVALEMNPQVIAAMTGPLRERGGNIYLADSVEVINQEARGYLATTDRRFDVIQVPPIGAFGASGAGLYATRESYLYTVESFETMLDHLSEDGVLCLTRWGWTPPRDELRAFHMLAEALRRRGLGPATRLAMIRYFTTPNPTVTILAFKRALTPRQTRTLQTFCQDRNFGRCWLPDLAPTEVNEFHELPRPYYFEAAKELLGPGRDAYLSAYPFEITAVTDDRPYFFQTFRWRALPMLARQARGRGPAHLPLGYLMSVVAVGQGILVAAALILLPLLVRIQSLRSARRRAAVFAYFLALGLGFMLLEMGFLQKLILYLSHPIYSAAAVIASFLVFSGLGSQFSRHWKTRPKRVVAAAATVIIIISLAYSLVLDGWLGLTQAQPIALRFLVACATIAPLAFAMGHMFPTGLRQVGKDQPGLVPWAWAVNGFASVVATVATPLLAAEVGFGVVILTATVCYAAAGIASRWVTEG